MFTESPYVREQHEAQVVGLYVRPHSGAGHLTTAAANTSRMLPCALNPLCAPRLHLLIESPQPHQEVGTTVSL